MIYFCYPICSNKMETSIQNYFWLVDRLNMDDDQRNKVNMQSDSVSLSEVLTEYITSGELITKLLQ